MRYFVTLILLFASSMLQAETRFITDEVLVPLRSSPCNRCSIIHQGIKSGSALQVIREGSGDSEGWTQVRTRSGLEGWMPTQYLLDQQVAKVKIIAVEKQLAAEQMKNRELANKLRELDQSNNKLEGDLRELSTQNNDIDSELRRIKQVSANALNLEKQNQELLKRNGILQSKIDVLTAANEQLARKDSQTWFLYGAIAVVLGALLTVILPRLKRRKGFSEWA